MAKVIQSMVIFDVLVKRKASLDQLREGLKTLNVLKAVQEKSDSMKRYFLANSEVSHTAFFDKCHFVDCPCEGVENFKRIIGSFDVENMSKLLKFITGGSTMIALSQNHVTIKFKNTASIFVSTCSFELTIPEQIASDSKLLKESLLAVIDSSWSQSFNSI